MYGNSGLCSFMKRHRKKAV
uniref:Uncharacterized protein n=1 Tax=Anguilla anguilla TaxID=7936 RepID=A0A0E9VMS8_ANGAN